MVKLEEGKFLIAKLSLSESAVTVKYIQTAKLKKGVCYNFLKNCIKRAIQNSWKTKNSQI